MRKDVKPTQTNGQIGATEHPTIAELSSGEPIRGLRATSELPDIETLGPDWRLDQVGFVPEIEHEIESRFAISNGYLGMRASLPSMTNASRPRMFVSGLFGTPPQSPTVPSLIPVPNWHWVRIAANGSTIRLDRGATLELRRVLDLRRGAYWVLWRYQSATGQVVRARVVHFFSLTHRALAVQLAEVEAEQECLIDVDVWSDPPQSGLVPDLTEDGADVGVWRTAEDSASLAMAQDSELATGKGRVDPQFLTGDGNLRWSFSTNPHGNAAIRRVASYGRGATRQEALDVATDGMAEARRLGALALFDAHSRAWSERWDMSDVRISGDPAVQQAVRFALYHMIGAVDPTDEHVSIGARALTGDAYMGHVFWDTEIFLLPFYIYTWPAAARTLLMYRYHTLPAARAKAKRLGFRGAFYAWESASDGEEACPPFVVGPGGKVIRIVNGEQEAHISADVAYAIWQYWQATGDDDFFQSAGAEIIIETARFWASRAKREKDNRWHIRKVVGPDEYHEAVDDNAYTNVMAQWNIERALEISDAVASQWPAWWESVSTRLGVTNREIGSWRKVADGMTVGYDSDSKVIEQFEGYFGLRPIFAADYPSRHEPLDVILGREATQISQVHKQADAVMLTTLLADRFSPEVREATFRFYEPRCGHGSSLSPAIHALVAARCGDIELAERYFEEAANIDLKDTYGNAAHGIHIGALGGLWQAIVFGFAGLSFTPTGIRLDPRLPRSWSELAFRIHWHGRRLLIEIDRTQHKAHVELELGSSLSVEVQGQTLAATKTRPVDCVWGQAESVDVETVRVGAED